MASRLLAVGAITAASAALLPAAAQADPTPTNCKSAEVYDDFDVPGAEAWCVGGSSGQFRIAIHCFRVALPSYWSYGAYKNVASSSYSVKYCSGATDSLKSFKIEYK